MQKSFCLLFGCCPSSISELFYRNSNFQLTSCALKTKPFFAELPSGPRGSIPSSRIKNWWNGRQWKACLETVCKKVNFGPPFNTIWTRISPLVESLWRQRRLSSWPKAIKLVHCGLEIGLGGARIEVPCHLLAGKLEGDSKSKTASTGRQTDRLLCCKSNNQTGSNHYQKAS